MCHVIVYNIIFSPVKRKRHGALKLRNYRKEPMRRPSQRSHVALFGVHVGFLWLCCDHRSSRSSLSLFVKRQPCTNVLFHLPISTRSQWLLRTSSCSSVTTPSPTASKISKADPLSQCMSTHALPFSNLSPQSSTEKPSVNVTQYPSLQSNPFPPGPRRSKHCCPSRP